MRAGYVAIVGLPNAGKSTLLNKFVGQKVSIVTHKAQTTRMPISGILTKGDTQIIFIDTPGVLKGKTTYERQMAKSIFWSIDQADQIVCMVDAGHPTSLEKLHPLFETLTHHKRMVSLVFNKIDTVKKEKLLVLASSLSAIPVIKDVFMISASKGHGVEDLENFLLKSMPERPWPYDAEQLSEHPERVLAAEMTREKIFLVMHDEIPYGVSVISDKWEETPKGEAKIYQTIFVEKDQHKAMILGKNGARIRQIGESARHEIEAFLGRKAHLFLHVKVNPDWKNDPFRDTMDLVN